MQIAAAGADFQSTDENLNQVLTTIQNKFNGTVPHIGFLFISSHFQPDLPQMVSKIKEQTGVSHLVGCTCESVIGPDHEYEEKTAVSLWMASFPNSQISSFHLSKEAIKDANTRQDWQSLFKLETDANPQIFLLGDPFTTDVNALLSAINEHFPGFPLIGGMASGAGMPGENLLVHNEQSFNEGAVGITLTNGVTVDTVVSQGCRPVGKPYMITQGEFNAIQRLGTVSPLQAINETYENASANDRKLMEQGLFIGRVIDEYKEEFKRGDFLIRNLTGADKESGAVTVMDRISPGITIQFHVRDAETADEDLRMMLEAQSQPTPAGGLIFSCNGRGTRMYSDSNHDLQLVQNMLESPPLAGFFCAGELGPIGGKNFIHGHTASIALFREAK